VAAQRKGVSWATQVCGSGLGQWGEKGGRARLVFSIGAHRPEASYILCASCS
jgi:hypothetical protein